MFTSQVLPLFCSYLWCCPWSTFIYLVLIYSIFISLLLLLLFASYLWCCPCSIFIYLVLPLFNMHISGVAPFQYSYIWCCPYIVALYSYLSCCSCSLFIVHNFAVALVCSYICVSPISAHISGGSLFNVHISYVYISGVAFAQCLVLPLFNTVDIALVLPMFIGHTSGVALVHGSCLRCFQFLTIPRLFSWPMFISLVLPLFNVPILGVASVLCSYQPYYLWCCPRSVHISGVAPDQFSYLWCCPWLLQL